MHTTTYLLVTDLEVDTALVDPAFPLAVRAVWQLLWESEVRPDEVLALDVPDAELDDRLVVIRHSKEGDLFETGITAAAAGVLRELIGTRTEGPLFIVNGRRLSKGEVATAFRAATGGRSLHALRFTRQRKERDRVRRSATARQTEEKSA
ncbi:tyrosine-type recombinase/integrase [Streptomyces sp. PSKA30]|uniref:tyrosine-type recombinase/integrase n=1 Tax=Streptomyces sp. PSKA30 TaxID=2874597 RepID=UPI001CD05D99|nr:tyrosine-type recombinase/integrase [Streptomyces sp. PSKA30]MBZ9641390.1 tyrosine-type recombinase/integrase [Streptomyces sp. PSKA30]